MFEHINFPNTKKRVENTTRSGVFLTNFEELENAGRVVRKPVNDNPGLNVN